MANYFDYVTTLHYEHKASGSNKNLANYTNGIITIPYNVDVGSNSRIAGTFTNRSTSSDTLSVSCYYTYGSGSSIFMGSATVAPGQSADFEKNTTANITIKSVYFEAIPTSGSGGNGGGNEGGDSGDTNESTSFEILWNYMSSNPSQSQFLRNGYTTVSISYRFTVLSGELGVVIPVIDGELITGAGIVSDNNTITYTFPELLPGSGNVTRTFGLLVSGNYKINDVQHSQAYYSQTYKFTQIAPLAENMGDINNNSSYYGQNIFIYPNENYSLSWPSLGEGVNYTLLKNQGLIIASGLKDSSVTLLNTLKLKEKISYYIKAKGIEGSTSQSNELTLYNLLISPQTQISSSNIDLISGSTTLRWEPPKIIVNDEILSGFTVKYNLKYRKSSDRENWSELSEPLVSNYEYTEHIIPTITDILTNGEFINFVIENQIFYNGQFVKTVTTSLEEDGFIKYAGIKPNQLQSVEFYAESLITVINKGKRSSIYSYKEDNYGWEEPRTLMAIPQYTENNKSKMIITFGAPMDNYIPGVRITWKKGNITKFKDFFTENTFIEIPFNVLYREDGEELFFDNEFWKTDNDVILTIASAGQLKNTTITVLEEAQGYLYRGIDIQPAKLPEMLSEYSNISTNSSNIQVNFDSNNPQPIVDDKYYEDIKIEGIHGNQSQGINIYSYKVVAKINTKEILITEEKLLNDNDSNSKFEEGWFTPNRIGGSINLELDILKKNKHIENLLEQSVNSYFERFNIEYQIYCQDEFGQLSNNYFKKNFYYDCRKPAIFKTSPIITGGGDFSIPTQDINPYGETLTCLPVFNDDSLIIEFYPAYNERDILKNPNNYNNGYLKYSQDNSIQDVNGYSVYKFIKANSEEDMKPIFIEDITAYGTNAELKRISENINGVEVLKYLYKLNLILEDKNEDEIVGYQIIPYYIEEGTDKRISRIFYYENKDYNNDGQPEPNKNKFNLLEGLNESSARFWISRLSDINISTTGIERTSISLDNFGLSYPKIKLNVTDWGTTYDFKDRQSLNIEELQNYNRFNELSYNIEYEREDGSKLTTWNREYKPNTITYKALAAEYGKNSFEEIYNLITDEQIKNKYQNEDGSYNSNFENTSLYLPVTGSTLYINLPEEITNIANFSKIYYATLNIVGKINRISSNADNNGNIIEENILTLKNYKIFISKNNKTFQINQGRIAINLPEFKEIEETIEVKGIEESFYVVDKNHVQGVGEYYPNTFAIEGRRNRNKIKIDDNNIIGGSFIGFYDDSEINLGERKLMGSIGFKWTVDGNGNEEHYTPYLIYSPNADGQLTSLNLIPEAGTGIVIEGNLISHINKVEPQKEIFRRFSYDSEGHITESFDLTADEIKAAAGIKYDIYDPTDSGNLISGNEGDIYFWIQLDTQTEE